MIMVLDNVKNSKLYFNLNDKFKAAFDFIDKAVSGNYDAGKYEINGQDLYANIDVYNTKLAADGKFEGHKKYIDVQYVVSGTEAMKVVDVKNTVANSQDNAPNDCMFYQDSELSSVIIVEQGSFAIFYPNDIHMPGLALNDIPSKVKKIVVKVKI
jgi:YhcH/YjgK/YiaL family protein